MHFLRHTPICQNGCVGNSEPQQDFQFTKEAQIQRIQEQIQAMQVTTAADDEGSGSLFVELAKITVVVDNVADPDSTELEKTVSGV